MTKVPTNFIYPDIKPSDRRYAGFAGEILRADGNWSDFLPNPEDQRKNNVESSSCYVSASQYIIAILLEEKYGIKDSDFSARFNALLSDGTPNGGDPLRGGMSLKRDGLIPELMMPFNDEILSWNDFHSWKGVIKNLCIEKGKDFLKEYSLNFKVVVEKDLPVATKYILLKEALKHSPVALSYTAWYEKNGKYYKPEGLRDNHLIAGVALSVDENNSITILDTYAPHKKVLEPNANFEFAMSWEIERKQLTDEQRNIFLQILQKLSEWLGLISKQQVPTPPPNVVPEPPQPIKEALLSKIHNEALNWLGKDASPMNQAPQERACAESVCNILQKAGIEIPLLVSTIKLHEWLRSSPLFKQSLEYKEGTIIISPTGSGNGSIIGHAGICGKEKIMNNNSFTGKWDTNYTLANWVDRYRIKGGMKIYFYEAI